jgi:hypothetical protein
MCRSANVPLIGSRDVAPVLRSPYGKRLLVEESANGSGGISG